MCWGMYVMFSYLLVVIFLGMFMYRFISENIELFSFFLSWSSRLRLIFIVFMDIRYVFRIVEMLFVLSLIVFFLLLIFKVERVLLLFVTLQKDIGLKLFFVFGFLMMILGILVQRFLYICCFFLVKVFFLLKQVGFLLQLFFFVRIILYFLFFFFSGIRNGMLNIMQVVVVGIALVMQKAI